MKSLLLSTLISLILSINVDAATQACDSGSGVCVAFAIPVTSATDTSNPDILVSIQAPGNLGWVGFGFGEQMVGSLVFPMWPDNTNVVVSSRYASGEFEPAPYQGPTVSVLSSNITTDIFSAQLQISNATTWQQGGTLNVNSANAGVIWALGTIPVSEPSNPDSDFQQHKVMGVFSIDMKSAQVTQNPSSSGTPSSNGGATNTASSPTETSSNSDLIPTITGGVTPVLNIGLTQRDKIIIAHGVLMGLAFVILFPLGAIIIRFLSSILPIPTRLHYFTQIFTLAIVTAAVGLGIYISQGSQFTFFHQYFGIVIFCLLYVQLLFGWYHHHRFVKDQPTHRRWFTYIHMFLGRTLIVCGLINAGFGLNLAGCAWKYSYIWWGVMASLVVMYAVVSVLSMRWRRKGTGEGFGRALGPG